MEDEEETVHERERIKYSELAAYIREAGWRTMIYPVEVGCQGFVSTLTTPRHGSNRGETPVYDQGTGR